MKNIEIKTTQNVVLQYELASLRDRILAFLIDFVIMLFSILMLFAFANRIFDGTAMEVVGTLIFSLFMFYSLAFEVLNNGQSPGKMAMRIRVVKTTSGRPKFADLAARWVFRLVDIYFSLGGIASVLIASSSKGQRIGDIVANTAVIKLMPTIRLTLDDLLGMHAETEYSPVYAQAKKLVEEDAILIKHTLDRSRKFQNRAHGEAMVMLAREVASVLGIDPPHDHRTFLETVLRDYVRLTR